MMKANNNDSPLCCKRDNKVKDNYSGNRCKNRCNPMTISHTSTDWIFGIPIGTLLSY